MILKEIELQNFRNFDKSVFKFESNTSLLWGQNGQGKTNLLESIYLSTMGESFRDHSVSNFVKFGKQKARLKSLFTKNKMDYEVEILFESSGKKILLNGKVIKKSDLQNIFYSIVFSPDSLTNIKGGDEERRNLIDELLIISDKKNLELLKTYKKILINRNKILKMLKAHTNRKDLVNLLDSIQSIFLENATKITILRNQMLIQNRELYQKIFTHLLDTKNREVEIFWDYRVSRQSIENSSPEMVYNMLHKRSLELAQAEKSYGVSLVGPHKHEIKILYNGNDSRFFCSQGQQRIIILAFKFIQFLSYKAKYGYDPILLLDDVFSELDEQRREQLVDVLNNFKKQIFLTSTDNVALKVNKIKIEKVHV